MVSEIGGNQKPDKGALRRAWNYRRAIVARIDAQTTKGIEKYGQTLEFNPAGIVERLEHLAQELTDGLAYIEWVKECIADNWIKKDSETIETESDKSCFDCKYSCVPQNNEPCKSCSEIARDKHWEPCIDTIKSCANCKNNIDNEFCCLISKEGCKTKHLEKWEPKKEGNE